MGKRNSPQKKQLRKVIKMNAQQIIECFPTESKVKVRIFSFEGGGCIVVDRFGDILSADYFSGGGSCTILASRLDTQKDKEIIALSILDFVAKKNLKSTFCGDVVSTAEDYDAMIAEHQEKVKKLEAKGIKCYR